MKLGIKRYGAAERRECFDAGTVQADTPTTQIEVLGVKLISRWMQRSEYIEMAKAVLALTPEQRSAISVIHTEPHISGHAVELRRVLKKKNARELAWDIANAIHDQTGYANVFLYGVCGGCIEAQLE